MIERFNNRSLGDTIFRVGRDIPRKLSRNDRLIGALLLAVKHSVPTPFTMLIIPAAMLFRGKDDEGNLDLRDKTFVNEVFPLGIDYILRAICGLDNDREASLISDIKKAYEKITNDPKNWFNAVA